MRLLLINVEMNWSEPLTQQDRIEAADRIIVLHHGQIAEMGSHDELIARQGLYRRLYRSR